WLSHGYARPVGYYRSLNSSTRPKNQRRTRGAGVDSGAGRRAIQNAEAMGAQMHVPVGEDTGQPGQAAALLMAQIVSVRCNPGQGVVQPESGPFAALRFPSQPQAG